MIERVLRLLEYLFLSPGPAGPVYKQYAPVLLAVYATLLASVGFTYLVLRTLNGKHALRNWVARRISLVGAGVTVLGVALLAVRPLNWPVLSTRILLVLQLLALPVLAGYLWWWLQNRYPEWLELYEWEQRKKLYLPKAAGGTIERPRSHRAKKAARRN